MIQQKHIDDEEVEDVEVRRPVDIIALSLNRTKIQHAVDDSKWHNNNRFNAIGSKVSKNKKVTHKVKKEHVKQVLTDFVRGNIAQISPNKTAHARQSRLMNVWLETAEKASANRRPKSASKAQVKAKTMASPSKKITATAMKSAIVSEIRGELSAPSATNLRITTGPIRPVSAGKKVKAVTMSASFLKPTKTSKQWRTAHEPVISSQVVDADETEIQEVGAFNENFHELRQVQSKSALTYTNAVKAGTKISGQSVKQIQDELVPAILKTQNAKSTKSLSKSASPASILSKPKSVSPNTSILKASGMRAKSPAKVQIAPSFTTPAKSPSKSKLSKASKSPKKVWSTVKTSKLSNSSSSRNINVPPPKMANTSSVAAAQGRSGDIGALAESMKARVSVIAPASVIQVGTKQRKKSAKPKRTTKTVAYTEQELHEEEGPSDMVNISGNVETVTYVANAPRQSLNSKLIEERMAELEQHENKFQSMMASLAEVRQKRNLDFYEDHNNNYYKGQLQRDQTMTSVKRLTKKKEEHLVEQAHDRLYGKPEPEFKVDKRTTRLSVKHAADFVEKEFARQSVKL